MFGVACTRQPDRSLRSDHIVVLLIAVLASCSALSSQPVRMVPAPETPSHIIAATAATTGPASTACHAGACPKHVALRRRAQSSVTGACSAQDSARATSNGRWTTRSASYEKDSSPQWGNKVVGLTKCVYHAADAFPSGNDGIVGRVDASERQHVRGCGGRDHAGHNADMT